MLLRGRPKRVTSQGPELHEHEDGITPFDCLRDNCCQSLLLDPDATISIDLHKWLFLLVTEEKKQPQIFLTMDVLC